MEEITAMFYLGFFDKVVEYCEKKTNLSTDELFYYVRSLISLQNNSEKINSLIKGAPNDIKLGIECILSAINTGTMPKINEHETSIYYNICAALSYFHCKDYEGVIAYTNNITSDEIHWIRCISYLCLDMIKESKDEVENITNEFARQFVFVVLGLRSDSIDEAYLNLEDLVSYAERSFEVGIEDSPLLTTLYLSYCNSLHYTEKVAQLAHKISDLKASDSAILTDLLLGTLTVAEGDISEIMKRDNDLGKKLNELSKCFDSACDSLDKLLN